MPLKFGDRLRKGAYHVLVCIFKLFSRPEILCLTLNSILSPPVELQQNKHNEAIKECDFAIELDKNYDKAYHKRGHLNELLENYEESVRDYELLYKKLKTKDTKENLDRSKTLLARSKRKNYYKILGIAKTGKLWFSCEIESFE